MTPATEYPLNRHELFRAEITERAAGVQVVSIGRWKVAADGTRRRAGPALEVGCHRLAGLVRLVADLQRLVEEHQKEIDDASAARRASA
ncbi:hypothetical protein [Bradyrhizobium guangxiense]|uniref:hypothetical protein n=1 Tax=Bradyrhizobium guangxiense TaxID=1325115 RepID=UPI0010092162|nr:hypothetical protein [Bradyrhizobium guangxiense]